MARFKKRIVSAGRHLVSTPEGGRQSVTITPKRLEHWSDMINELTSKGHKVPAPFRHDLEAIPVQLGEAGSLETSYDNGGFWEEATIEHDENNVPWLTAYLDTPHDDKVGETIKDTSIYARPHWVDGKEQDWFDVPMHIACVTHPIEPGQPNFEACEEGAVAIAMSTLDVAMDASLNAVRSSAQASGNSLNDVLTELEQVAGIALGKDTTPDNIMERLAGALRQKRLSEQDSESAGTTSTPPNGAVRQNVPIQMSDQSNEVKVTDSPEYKALAAQNEALLMSVKTNKVDQLQGRIKALLESKRITEEYAESLRKKLEGFTMSFNDEGVEVKSEVEVQLDTLEQALPAQASTSTAPEGTLMSSVPAGCTPQDNPIDGDSPEKVADAVKSFLQNTR